VALSNLYKIDQNLIIAHSNSISVNKLIDDDIEHLFDIPIND